MPVDITLTDRSVALIKG
uniref:Uncharacterized protein n=1 Tax=Anguilla anguilla TaxID=7936 RepID=A0A0E9RGP5_ANGAN